MKTALIYNSNDPKLSIESYSQTYRHMFDSLIEVAGNSLQHITESCSAKDIDADIIIIYDVHSSHHIQIDGLENHKAIKYTYFNDPHQEEMHGRYLHGEEVYKLGAESRVKRAISRGIDFIICPYTSGYYDFIAPYLGSDADEMFVWFPTAPKRQLFNDKRLVNRRKEILANGHLWEGRNEFRPYEFRKWAYARKNIQYVRHCLHDGRIPKGNSFMKLISQWSGALALCDTYVVPKYLEIPLAGCLCFAQYNEDYIKMGFKDDVNCIFVDKTNFDNKIKNFISNTNDYQSISDRGQQLIEENWTSAHFASFIYNHCKSKLDKKDVN